MNEPVQPFTLTESEKHSPLWFRLVAHMEAKRKGLHGKIEGLMTEQETASIRGQLKCLRGLIDLGKESPPQDG